MGTKVYKAIVTLTVLFEAEDDDDARACMKHYADISDILYEMEDGEWIGQAHRSDPMPIPAGEVKTELLQIGNDGTFFEFYDWLAKVESELATSVDAESFRPYFDDGLSPNEAIDADREDAGIATD